MADPGSYPGPSVSDSLLLSLCLSLFKLHGMFFIDIIGLIFIMAFYLLTLLFCVCECMGVNMSVGFS